MRIIRAGLLLALLLIAALGRADWINLTGSETAPNIAEIYVMYDHVRLVFEVYIGDLGNFVELVPDAWLSDADATRPSVEERMQTFASERFRFVTETGEALPARLELVEPRLRVDRKSPFAGMINPLTRQRVPEAPADKRVLYAEIVYPFEGKPEQLTIMPPLDENDIADVTIGFIAYLISDLPQEVTVDWELFHDQIERIPATATDPAGPFVSYITPDDPLFSWTNYLKKYTVPTVEQVAVRGSLGDVRIPIVSLACGLLFVLLLGWLWQRRRAHKPLRAISIGLAVFAIATVVGWPYAGVVVARPALIAADLTDEQSRVLLQAMLKNVYRAFDFRNDEDVYDKLALSVDGELLADIYLQNRESFAVQRAGGAQAKVKSVDILSASAERADLAYRIRGNWTATGTVGHRGHIHVRENLYDALIRVEAVDGKWKITELEIVEEKRIEPGSARETAPATPAAG